MVETMIWQTGDHLLQVLDQTLLPQKCIFIDCKD